MNTTQIVKKNYECFSKKLHNFLLSRGHVPINDYIHNKTKVKCHVYKVTPELSYDLHEWKESNPNRY